MRDLRLPVATGRLLESALERASEAGSVFISDRGGDLFDAHIRMHKKIACSEQSLLGEQLPQTQASPLFEQVLQARFAQVAFESQIMNVAGRMRLDHLENFAEAVVLYYLNKLAQFGVAFPDQATARRGDFRL
jgi:hypothetical protein